MVRKVVDDLFLLAKFIEFNIRLFHEIPGETISTRQVVSQITSELRKLDDNQRRLFSDLFPAIDKKLHNIVDFQRISECYKQQCGENDESHCVLSPTEQWRNYRERTLEHQELVAIRNPAPRIRPDLPSRIISHSMESDTIVSSPWKRIRSTEKVCEVKNQQLNEGMESLDENYRNMVKNIILTGQLPDIVNSEVVVRKRIQTYGKSPKKLKKRGKNEHKDSIRSLLREARSDAHEHQISTTR